MGTWLSTGVHKLCRFPGISAAVRAMDRVQREREPLLRVLTYHRIDMPESEPTLNPALISATPEQFASQISFLADHFRIVSLAEVLDCVRQKHELPPRSLLLTFDDAYRDFAAHAWPILKQQGLPVTLFVPTGFPDQDRAFWWDRLYALARHLAKEGNSGTQRNSQAMFVDAIYQRLEQQLLSQHADGIEAYVEQKCREAGLPSPVSQVLGWDCLRRLSQEGVTIAPHTRSHALLDRLGPTELRLELTESLADLQNRLDVVPRVLAYPAGAQNRQVRQLVLEAGYTLAFTTRRGINRLSHLDPLRVGRINVGRRCSLPLLHAQLIPGMVRLNRWLN